MTWYQARDGECPVCKSAPVAFVKEVSGEKLAACRKCVNIPDDILLNQKLYGGKNG